jgi:hypothetical protein
MPTTTMANRMYFSNPVLTAKSVTKRRKILSIASREIQATVMDRASARANEAANRATNMAEDS